MKLVIDVLSPTSSLSSVVGVLENMRMYKSLSLHAEGLHVEEERCTQMGV